MLIGPAVSMKGHQQPSSLLPGRPTRPIRSPTYSQKEKNPKQKNHQYIFFLMGPTSLLA